MKTIINVKTDKSLKEEARQVTKELGIPLSTAINAFLRQLVRDRKLTLSTSSEPSEHLINMIKEAEADLEAGKVKTAKSVETLLNQ